MNQSSTTTTMALLPPTRSTMETPDRPTAGPAVPRPAPAAGTGPCPDGESPALPPVATGGLAGGAVTPRRTDADKGTDRITVPVTAVTGKPFPFPFKEAFPSPLIPFPHPKQTPASVLDQTPVCRLETARHSDGERLAFPTKAFSIRLNEDTAETASTAQTPVCPKISATLGVLAKALVMAQRAFDETVSGSLTSAERKGGAV